MGCQVNTKVSFGLGMLAKLVVLSLWVFKFMNLAFLILK